MAFNLFKKGTKEKTALRTARPLVEKKETSKKKDEVVKKAAPAVKSKGKKMTPALSSVLQSPHITEKASWLAEQKQYVFRVHPTATKGAVKQSVEALYGVGVKGVRLTIKPARKIGAGKRAVVKPGMKKAIVHLQEGQTLDIISR
ncbi:MAG: 50S ribosomal protein L23 [bacterium]|nr:50S ribosomal protein L23 [bacterium]